VPARDIQDCGDLLGASREDDNRGHLAEHGRPVEGVGDQVLFLGQDLGLPEDLDKLVNHLGKSLCDLNRAVVKNPA
jgi:hypothetical protein